MYEHCISEIYKMYNNLLSMELNVWSYFCPGSIPLRQLVYRVHPLPESMRPLVWDFGQLTHHTEELYTRQIVRRFVVPLTPDVSTAEQRVVCIMLQNTAYIICDLVLLNF